MPTPTKTNPEVQIEEIHIEHERVSVVDSSTPEPELERKGGLVRRTHVRGGIDTNQGP